MRVLLFLLFAINCFAQDIKEQYYNQYELLEKLRTIDDKNDTYRFNIRFIYIGNKVYNLDSNKIKLIKNRLNSSFRVTNIRFTYDKKIYSYYSNMTIDSCYTYESRIIDRVTYNRKDINFYIVDNKGKKYNGLATYPASDIHRLFINIDNLNDGTIEHEMGHYFGLLHTFENSPGNNGDMISDTSPDIEGLLYGKDCKLSGVIKDNKGNIYNIDLSNFMSYYGVCRNRFTTEQIKVMNKVAYYRTIFK